MRGRGSCTDCCLPSASYLKQAWSIFLDPPCCCPTLRKHLHFIVPAPSLMLRFTQVPPLTPPPKYHHPDPDWRRYNRRKAGKKKEKSTTVQRNKRFLKAYAWSRAGKSRVGEGEHGYGYKRLLKGSGGSKKAAGFFWSATATAARPSSIWHRLLLSVTILSWRPAVKFWVSEILWWLGVDRLCTWRLYHQRLWTNQKKCSSKWRDHHRLIDRYFTVISSTRFFLIFLFICINCCRGLIPLTDVILLNASSVNANC